MASGGNASQCDLSIFKNIFGKYSSIQSACSEDIKDCVVIQRLLTSLSYCHKLNDKLIFYDFLDSIYKHHVYEDMYHFTKYHQNQIQEIMDLAIWQYRMTM